jgi:hypothetical protein
LEGEKMERETPVENHDSGRVTSTGKYTYPYLYSPVEVTLSEYAKTICPKPLPLFDVIPLLTENLIIQTAYLKTYRKPISLVFIGKSGLGKSRLFIPLMKLDNVTYTNDITPKYLVEFLEKVKRGEKNCLAIPDFIHCTSHSKATRTVLTSILRSITEEGVKDLSDYHLEFKSEKPVKATLITATTTANYEEFAIEWKKVGFLSRLLPFSYNHSPRTQQAIRDFLNKRQPDPIFDVNLKVKKNPQKIDLPYHLANQLYIYEELLGKSTDSTPYRAIIQLNSLVEALAVLRGENAVTQEDIDIIGFLCNWINYQFREI